MISMTIRAGTGLRAARLRNWRVIAGLAGVAAGITVVTGAFLPWVETFAGLIGIPGIRGGNGRILAAGGLAGAVGQLRLPDPAACRPGPAEPARHAGSERRR